jgi:hypothetical protein
VQASILISEQPDAPDHYRTDHADYGSVPTSVPHDGIHEIDHTQAQNNAPKWQEYAKGVEQSGESDDLHKKTNGVRGSKFRIPDTVVIRDRHVLHCVSARDHREGNGGRE